MKKECDYIIIGQGLAGSCLALELAKQGKKIIVFNNPEGNSASRVASGLINPITGKKRLLTWRASELFPYLDTFYKNAEIKFKSKFYYKIPLYQPFINTEEQNYWAGKSIDSSIKPFIKNILLNREVENMVSNDYGGILIKKTSYLDTSLFLASVAMWLSKNKQLINKKFDVKEINFFRNGVVYKNIKARKIIFCGGFEEVGNPYFSEIKFKPVKGEVLKIKLKQKLTKGYSRGVFIIPRKESYLVGSNYNHTDLSWTPTESGKYEIETKLKSLLLVPYTLNGHKAGVRPTISDRRPVLGESKNRDQLVVFNGLGTKGVSLAPFFSNQLANWLCKGKKIDSVVNVNRFFNSKISFNT